MPKMYDIQSVFDYFKDRHLVIRANYDDSGKVILEFESIGSLLTVYLDKGTADKLEFQIGCCMKDMIEEGKRECKNCKNST